VKAGIGKGHGRHQFPVHAVAEEPDPENQHEERIGEQHQPLILRGDEAEAEKVEIARNVIAQNADRHGEGEAPGRQQGAQFLLAPQNRDQDDQIDRQRHHHAQGQQHFARYALGKGELDEDALGGKQHRAGGGEAIAGHVEPVRFLRRVIFGSSH
jgi:hypothetical protein